MFRDFAVALLLTRFVNFCENKSNNNKSSSFPLNGIGFSEKNIVSKWKDLYKLGLSSPLCVKTLAMKVLDTSDSIGGIVFLSEKAHDFFTSAKGTLSHG